jgi:Alpha-galactosidases/6-phospho-beta-glucosidases, family 4 of glycosyl hydrolases
MDRLKIVVIGGGSSYTPELAEGFIKNRDTLPVGELVLVDVENGRKKVEVICALVQRMFKKENIDIAVSCTLDRKKALEGADFIISQFRVGGIEARSRDEKIPLKYGIIGQETTGPGGFTKALRTIPVVLDICRDIENICPDAWLINFTNPSGIITEAVHKNSKVKCMGLCNVPINMIREVSNAIGINKSKIHCCFAGLNHLSFIGKLYINGRDVLKDSNTVQLIKDSVVKNIPNVQMPSELLTSLGFIPSSYLKYYYLERQMFEDESKHFKETGKTRADEVAEVEKKLFDKYMDANLCEKPAELAERGGSLYSEAAVSLIDSIWNDRGDIHVVNALNNGCVPELPFNVIIETNCIIRREGAVPLSYGLLPKSIKGLVQHAKAYEELTIEAAVERSRVKAYRALINNPLVHDANDAKLLLDDLLECNSEYIDFK